MKNSNALWVLGHKITPHLISGDYDLVTIETPPHVAGPPPHLHHTYTESFIVIEGEMEFMVNGETKVLKAGESIEIPPNTLHTFSNKSDQTCKWVDIHSPKGFIDFFAAIGIPVGEDNAQENSVAPAVVEKVVESAADYDMRLSI